MIDALNSGGYMRLLFSSFLAVTMTCASAAFAQTPSLDPLQTAGFLGTIRDTSAAPVPNAKVRLSSSGSPAVETKTDSSGRFEISDRPGDCILEVVSPGFRIYKSSIHLSTDIPNVKEIVLDLAGGSNVTPEPPRSPIKTLGVPLARTMPLPLMPSETSAITGTVTDIAGVPISEATVTLKSRKGLLLKTKTGRDGRFVITATPNDYTLKVDAVGFLTNKESIHLTDTTSIKRDTVLQIDPKRAGYQGPCCFDQPSIELLKSSITSTLPLNTIPSLKLHSRNPKKLH
ncbi:MAG TPA: carboxypeptidase-like regulatory domain-containing protein [Edaphobacter sp.]|nr:carboxypeptidase-like regulatory domain-containing protein [Edaphobacter sp.]